MNPSLSIKHLYFSILCLSILLLSSMAAKAQVGTITGHITSSDGKPAAFVNVTLKGATKGTTTSDEGNYLIKHVKPGSYTLIVSFVGLQTQEKQVSVVAGEVAQVDFVLSEASQQLSDVVVTGRKTMNEQPVNVGKIAIRPMDLPQSIAIIDREIMDQQQTLRISDVLRNANGVYTMGTTGGIQEEIAARGFAFGSNNTFRNGVRFNNGVMPETSSLEKVEILKGSSAILFGNVAAGGVLNLVTKKPKFENGGELSMRIGSYNFYKPSLDVYGAINNSDKIAYRLNTTYENAQSFRDEVKSERFYINPSVLFKATSKTDILVEGDYLKDNRTPDYGVGAFKYTILDVPRNRFLGASWGNYQVEQKSITTTITHRLNQNWQLRAIGGIQKYNSNLYATSRPTSFNAKDSTQLNRSLQRSANDETYFLAQVDLTGQFSTGFLKHNLLFGADADQYRSNSPSFGIYANLAKPDSIDARYDKINVFNLGEFASREDIPSAVKLSVTKNITGRGGVYLQDLLSISDKLKVLAGIRYTYIEISSNIYTNATKTTPASVSGVPTRYDHAFTPRFGIVYQPLKTTSIFTSYANSFNQNTAVDPSGATLPPSFIDQYEVGVKNDLFKGLLSANVTIYRIVNSNLSQVILQTSPNFNPDRPNAQELAGEVTSQGVEVDLSTRTVHGFSFIGGYSYNQTKYTKSNIFEVGSRLRYNPAHTANASMYYTFQNTGLKGFNVGLSSFYMAGMVAGRSTRLTIPNDAFRLIPLPNIFQLDASAGYSIHNVSLRLRITNLLNVLGYYAHDDNSINPIAPRQYAATVSYKF
ncbi:TonB-dependent receptor [Rhodocytophaga aerolata]|uniref:TonB-dependent receptor n=1 Tax=Rhodocytophaga aerolata TaxID=455078 RepID=A0ABT8R7U1_9BACT|nr:TonB-dependent receptor [Rhodocytophaga aerolata]MDO1448172.1 TonB-dependent receptor [Rhodocytophaga aerolata]